ncbi:MAG: ATP-binding protein [Chitinophagaceae bacterium]
MPCYVLAQDNFSGDFEKRKNKAVSELKNFSQQDTARVNALIRVLKKASFMKQMKQVMPYYEEALAISRKINDVKGLAECYRFMGSFYKSSMDQPNAQNYFDSVIQITRNIKDSAILEVRAVALRWKGMIYYDQENYYEALNYLFESLKQHQSEAGSLPVYLYQTITQIYIRLNNFEQASFYAKKNMVLAEKSAVKVYLIQAYLALVDISIQKGEFHLALYYLDKIKPYMPDQEETMLDFAYYENRGRICYQLQQYDSSFSYYQLAYRYAEVSGHTLNTNTALYFLTTIALKLGETAAAKKYGEENLALAEKIDSKGGRIKALMNLSDYYHQTGNNTRAFDFLEKATFLKDSLLSETNIKQANTLAAVYETDKKQKEILKLQNEKQAQDASVRHKSTLNIVFIATIIGLLVFGYLAYRTVKNEQKITNQQQEIQKQQISELEKDRQLLTVDAMLKGQEEERGRIAKDLHDGLGGMLSGVKLSFINMKENMVLPAENLRGFEKSIEMLDETIKELRKVAHNLMPETLVRFGLEESLKDFCNSIQSATGIRVIYQQVGENRKLPTQAQITVYRIVQELVNNALKHAEAKQIIVQLTKDHIKTGITVEDNGKGFDVKNIDLRKGAGFRNIKDRVNYFKGTLDINSQPGNGTSVNIELKT